MFGKKKQLKKIPADTVSYIHIEAEAIKNATDKHMIASYCDEKLEMVEWYIALLDQGSDKYIVPHTREKLVEMRNELKKCRKMILDTPIPKPRSQRPIIDIEYPKGYEG